MAQNDWPQALALSRYRNRGYWRASGVKSPLIVGRGRLRAQLWQAFLAYAVMLRELTCHAGRLQYGERVGNHRQGVVPDLGCALRSVTLKSLRSKSAF